MHLKNTCQLFCFGLCFYSLLSSLLSSVTAALRCLYKLSTSKVFEKNTSQSENSETNGKDAPSEGSGSSSSEHSPPSMVDIDCFAVNIIELCIRSRTLLVAGTSHAIVYQFSTVEETLEFVVGFFCHYLFEVEEV